MWDSRSGEIGLVVENSTEVLAVWKEFILQRQKAAPRIDQIDAGQPVLRSDLLRSKMFLHSERKVCAPLYRRVVRDNDAFNAANSTDPRNDAGARGPVVIDSQSRKGRDFEKWRSRIDQRIHAVTRQELPTSHMLCPRRLRSPSSHLRGLRSEIRDERMHGFRVRSEVIRTSVESRIDDLHTAYSVSEKSSRPISIRRISDVPAPIS